jgi:hypothetical protein
MLLFLLSLSGFCDSSDGGTNELNNTNSVISRETEPYNLRNEHKILSAEQQEQATYQAKHAEIQSRIDSLQNEIASRLADAKSAHKTVEQTRLQYLYTKSILKDPWREIYGEKKFAMSANPTCLRINKTT